MDRLMVFSFPALFQFIRFRAGKAENIVNPLHDSLHGHYTAIHYTGRVIKENRRTDAYVQCGGFLAKIIYGGFRMSLRGVSGESLRTHNGSPDLQNQKGGKILLGEAIVSGPGIPAAYGLRNRGN